MFLKKNRIYVKSFVDFDGAQVVSHPQMPWKYFQTSWKVDLGTRLRGTYKF